METIKNHKGCLIRQRPKCVPPFCSTGWHSARRQLISYTWLTISLTHCNAKKTHQPPDFLFPCLFRICIPVNLIKTENLGNANSVLMKFNDVHIGSILECCKNMPSPGCLKKVPPPPTRYGTGTVRTQPHTFCLFFHLLFLLHRGPYSLKCV